MNNKINRLHERSLRIVHSDKISNYSELLEKDSSVSIHTRNLQTLALEMFKFIKEMGTKGDPDLLLVDNRKGKASVYDFQLLSKNADNIDLEVASRIVDKMPSIFVYDKNLGPKAGELMQLRYTYSPPGVSSRSGKAKGGRHRILVDGGELFKNLTNIANAKKGTQTQPKTTPDPKKSSPAPQQKVATGNDGQRYTHYGLQWINQETGRIATKSVAAHLDQNTHLQTPVSA